MGIMDKAKDFLNSDQGKEKTGEALDKAEQAATDKFGQENADKIGKVREQADKQLGLDEQGEGGQQ